MTTGEYYYNVYLKSEEWKILREEVLSEYDYKCALCGATEDLNVHHMHYVDYQSGEHDSKYNLVCLCKACHFKIHEEKKIEDVCIKEMKETFVKALLNDKSIRDFTDLIFNAIYGIKLNVLAEALGKKKTKNLNKLISYFNISNTKIITEIFESYIRKYCEKNEDRTKLFQLFSSYRKKESK